MRPFFGKVPRAFGPLAFVALATGSSLTAQSGPSSTGARSQPLGARVLALGGLDVALADPEAVAANPALLLTARGLAVSVQGQHRGGAAGSAAMISTVGPVTFGLVARHAGPPDDHLPMGRPAWIGGGPGDHLAEHPATTALTLSAARTVKGQRLGVGVTYANDGADAKPGTLSLDLGYQRPLWMGLLGVSATALDPGMAPDLRLAAGWFASRAVGAAWDVGVGVQASVWGDGELQPVGAAELSYVPIQGVALTLRSGVRTPRGATQGILTAGLGASLDHLAVDYALAPLRDGGGVIHRVGLRIR